LIPAIDPPARFDNLEALLPAVRSLGQRHVGYGVQPHHYGTVGAALIDTLAKGLGDAFTPAAAHAWTITYTTLADAMRDASYGPSAPLAQAG
jgi:nitric oxide dioxygenase